MIKILFIYLVVFLHFLEAATLDIETCIEKSLKNHPDIKRASLAILYAQQTTQEVQSAYLPQINLHAQYSAQNTFVLPQNGTFNTVNDSFWQLSATLNQKIYDFGATTSLVDAYEQVTQEEELNLKDAKAFMVYTIKKIYNLALLHQRTLESRLMDVQTKQALYQQSLALVQEGLKTEIDSASFESSLYLAHERLEETQIEFQKALATLFFYMGEEPTDEELKNSTLLEHKPTSASQDPTRNQALSNNFSLRALDSEIQATTLRYKAAQLSHYGSLDAYASYSYQESLSKYDTSQIGISLSIPLYTGGSLSAKSEQLRLQKETLQAFYTSKELALREQIQATLLNLQKYTAIAKSKQATIKASLGAKKIAEARYKEGLATYIEVLDANTQYLNAKIGLELNAFSIAEALYQLEYIQGSTE